MNIPFLEKVHLNSDYIQCGDCRWSIINSILGCDESIFSISYRVPAKVFKNIVGSTPCLYISCLWRCVALEKVWFWYGWRLAWQNGLSTAQFNNDILWSVDWATLDNYICIVHIEKDNPYRWKVITPYIWILTSEHDITAL